ncbi:DoxX family membrane protein [Haloferax sp. MBLA0076]|uniref:DoxX family membrane protein n=1 Tax=Haloferax litoreum TaxID=2666140 RepID=A0A6A8GMI0_9EURY|nr:MULTISPECIES: DoxX family protein [Haloferax]KAB1194367.1 DoxX family protein [Haloferax sp. CBA1148]MRX22930.1 DoxX family membrane protein [Haloferax litoreum]
MSTALQFAGAGTDVAFLAARVLFGAVIAFMGLNHFMNVDQMSGYAEMKGLPAPRFGVVFSGGMLVFGGLGIAAGVFPALAAGAVALFLLVSTPLFHNFWAVPEDQQQSEMTDFLKNVVMLGGALVFLALSSVTWPYAIGVGLF